MRIAALCARAAWVGLLCWTWEVLLLTQTRETFRLGPAILPSLALVLGVLVAATLGGLLVARVRGRAADLWGAAVVLLVLASVSFGLQVFEESTILGWGPRLALAVPATLLPLFLALRGARGRRRWSDGRVFALAAGLWCFTLAIDRVPRDLLLDAYGRDWTAVLLGLARVAVALVGAWGVSRLAETRRPALGAAAWGASALLVVGVASPLPVQRPTPAAAATRQLDVVYIVLDSLRYDTTSLHPLGGDATPALAALARRGVSFARASSPSTMTAWSLPYLTGLETERPLGPRTRFAARRPSWASALPGRFQAAGVPAHLLSDYASTTLSRLEVYAWDSVAALPERWFRLGVLPAVAGAALTGQTHKLSSLAGDKYPFGPGGAAAALDERLAATATPGFHLVHLAVPHAPYNEPPYRARSLPPMDSAEALALVQRFDRIVGAGEPEDRQKLRALYLLAVRAADEQLAALLEVVARRRGDEAIIVVTSDHGEPLAEHGVFGHGRTLFGEGHHVPLVVVAPGLPAGRVVERVVSNAQLPATLLELTGHASDEDRERSLLRDLEPGFPERTVAVWHPRGSMVARGSWRLVFTEWEVMLDRPATWTHRKRFELYDIATDPGETRDRFDEAPPARAALLDALETHWMLPPATRAAAAGARPPR